VNKVRSENLVKPKKTKDHGDKKIIAQRKLSRRGHNMTRMRIVKSISQGGSKIIL
jgi:hypothetical protein